MVDGHELPVYADDGDVLSDLDNDYIQPGDKIIYCDYICDMIGIYTDRTGARSLELLAVGVM